MDFFLLLSECKPYFTVPLVFFSTTAYGLLSFILLARKWPKLMQHWEFVESILPPFKTQTEKNQLAKHVRSIATIVISVAFGMLFNFL